MIDLSVIIVSYNVRERLASCLLSLERGRAGLAIEVIVIDNASTDGSVEMIRERFPWVKLSVNAENHGFAKANNEGLARASGRHLMLLNPDTILREDSLSALVSFLDEHPEYGAAGPKLLNRDGAYQPTGKRSIPTPWSSFCKLSGLSNLFPHSRIFSSYELGHLDEDERHDVGTLCGAAMMVRRATYEDAGGLDEEYFMFGEDIAWSDAITRGGWKIAYVPDAPIMHFKGQSTRQNDRERELHFFNAMKVFYRKRFRPGMLRTLFMDLSVEGVRFASKIGRYKRSWRQPLIDLILLALVVWVLLPLLSGVPRAGADNPTVAPLLVVAPVLMLALLGAYRARLPREHVRLPFAVASLVVFAFLAVPGYFLAGADSRVGLVLLLWAGFGSVLLAGRRTLRTLRRVPRSTDKSVVVGPDDVSRAWVTLQHKQRPLKNVWGWAVWGAPEEMPATETLGLPIVARVEELPKLAKTGNVRRVIFSAGSATYTQILEFLELSPLAGAEVNLIDESSLWPAPETARAPEEAPGLPS
ncbi:MAG: N-acetylglucosaminyl-diphospho-decaprenol L-rhamnosyltransferase [Calditrichaeota bacterium]|nr:N-acetylglucosaminyl-diphospho-decaprenol L-rhamnosyltransferase [Calditrichota bacterium]